MLHSNHEQGVRFKIYIESVEVIKKKKHMEAVSLIVFFGKSFLRFRNLIMLPHWPGCGGGRGLKCNSRCSFQNVKTNDKSWLLMFRST